MIWRSVPQPDLGWGAVILAVLAGIILPALPAFALLWIWQVDLRFILDDAPLAQRGLWFLASGLTVAPMFFWLAVPVATPLVLAAARRGWVGPGTLLGLGLALGLPIVHWLFNGDLTSEAPEMIPAICAVLVVQSLCVWLCLRMVLRWRAGLRVETVAE